MAPTTLFDAAHAAHARAILGRDTPELSPAEVDAVDAFVDAQLELNTWEGREVPAAVSEAYETAYNGLPRWYRDLVDLGSSEASSTSTTPFTQIPYRSTTVLGPYVTTTVMGELRLETYTDGGPEQFKGASDCGPTNTGNLFPAVATVPTMATATSTFTIPGSNAACFLTATGTSDRGIYGPTFTLGSSAFTRSMLNSAIEGPCPKYYTLDVVYPLGESPHSYTTMQFRDIVYLQSLAGICCPIATATTDTWKFFGSVCTRTITGNKNNPTPQTPLVIPYHIKWNGHRHEFATSTVSGENWISTVVVTQPIFGSKEGSIKSNWIDSNLWELEKLLPTSTATGVNIPAFTVSVLNTPTGVITPDIGQTKDNSRILWPIIGVVVATILICGAVGHVMVRRARRGTRAFHNLTPPRPINRPINRPPPPHIPARTTNTTSTPARQREVPATLQPEQIDPPPIYSLDPRDGEVMLSRLDPVSATASSDDHVGRSASVGGTSDEHLSWNHLEIPSPGYVPPSSTGREPSPAGSIGGGSARALLDVPAEPAPAYTVLRD